MSSIPKILDWRLMPRYSLLGFAKVEFPSGLIISDVTILNGERGPWASPPAKPMVPRDGTVMKDDGGRVRYTPIIEFSAKDVRSKWSDSVIDAMRATHPEVFEDARPSPAPASPQRSASSQRPLPAMTRRKSERIDDDDLPF